MAAGNRNSKDNEVSEMDCKVVAAIDFGTSYCGYAYSYKATKEKFTSMLTFPEKESFPPLSSLMINKNLWHLGMMQ